MLFHTITAKCLAGFGNTRYQFKAPGWRLKANTGSSTLCLDVPSSLEPRAFSPREFFSILLGVWQFTRPLGAFVMSSRWQAVGQERKSKIQNPTSKIPTVSGFCKRGIFSLQYVMLWAMIIVVCSIGMLVYMKRAVSDRYRQVGDAFGNGRQYEPGVTRITSQ